MCQVKTVLLMITKWLLPATHLLVGVFMGLQGLHDGELGVVLEARRLVAQDLFQHPQSQGSDSVLETESVTLLSELCVCARMCVCVCE